MKSLKNQYYPSVKYRIVSDGVSFKIQKREKIFGLLWEPFWKENWIVGGQDASSYTLTYFSMDQAEKALRGFQKSDFEKYQQNHRKWLKVG